MKAKHLLTILLFLLTGKIALAQAPVITSFSPSVGPPGTLVVVRGTSLGSATGVSIAGKPAIIVSNTAIKIVAMVMPGATAGGVSVTTAGGSANAPSGTYTVTNNGVPSLQSNRLSAADLVGNPSQGIAVAISADGNTAIVGGYTDNSNTGAAWVYKLRGGTWVSQSSKLVGTGAVGPAAQGFTVAISADGNTAIVGGNSDDSNTGAAWVFIRQPDSTWVQQGAKIAGTGASSFFGRSVALSADGNTAVIGADGDNTYVGSTSVFVRSGSTWTQQGPKLVGTGYVGTTINQGNRVAISADGNTLLTGGVGDDSVKGAVWVFTRSGAVWSQQGSKLVGTGYTGASYFGFALALSADGNTALIGGPGDDMGKGAASVFMRSGTTWTEFGGKLATSDGIGNGTLGCSVALSADGKTAVLGASYDNAQRGATWIFKLIGGAYTQQGTKLVSTDAIGTAEQGTSVAISANGLSVMVGGPKHKAGKGAVWAFSTVGPVITSISPASGPIGTLVTINGTGMSGATACSIGGKPAIIVSNTATKVVGMVMPGAVTGAVTVTAGGGNNIATSNFTVTEAAASYAQQGGRLSASDLTGNSEQGISVALSADGNTAIVGGYSDNGGVGGVWIYKLRNGSWILQSGKLIGTGVSGATAYQGFAVALSADGNIALVGGYGDNSLQGAAWTYMRQPDSTWVQLGSKITGTGGVGIATFGYSVALSADGNTAVIGGFADNSNTGATWFFSRSGGLWTQQGSKTVGTGAIGAAAQGADVAISADGNTAMVNGLNDNGGIGAVWVYTRSGTTWTQQGAKLVETGNTGNANFGSSVALNADGNAAVMGAYGDNNTVGAAWFFTRSGSTWTQYGSKVVPSDRVSSARIGTGVGISADGKTAVLGGAGDNGSRGAIWVYKLVAGTWTQQGNKLIGSDVIGYGQQGTSVAISANGLAVISGGPGHKSGKGASWVFNTTTTAPTIASFSPASGPVGTLVTITGTYLDNPVIGGVPAVIISNTGTKLVAMVMPGAITGSVAVTSNGSTTTAAGTFTITNPDAPTTQLGSKIMANNTIGQSWQGFSVALSANGTTAVVGGDYDNNRIGAAWIYKFSGGTWVQVTKLIGTGATGQSYQGSSAVISADGNTVMIGGVTSTGHLGAAWVFIRQADSSWVQQGSILTAPSGPGAIFWNHSIALSADGNTAVIGGHSGAGADVVNGGAWIFVRNAGVWAQQGGTLIGTGAVGNAFQGVSTAISANGNTVMISGLGDNGGRGAAWVFTRSGSVWSQQGGKLTGSEITTSSNFGTSVALSADGNIAVINGLNTWIFNRTGSTWTQTGSKLAAGGNSLSLSADGNTFVTGVWRYDNGIGATYIFKKTDSTYVQQGGRILGTGYNTSGDYVYQGFSVAISADGQTMFTGGYADNYYQGATWAFTVAPSMQMQSISFNRPFALTSASEETEASASATSGLPVSYTSSDPKIAQVINGRIRMLGRGTVTITATQPGNDKFKPAEPVSHTLNVGRSLMVNSLKTITEPVVDPALSPNGDGKNDELTISNIEMYPDNKLSIINTNGDRVFEATGYNNQSKTFDGRSIIDSKQQKPGTYYYRLEYKDNGVLKSKTGYIVIKY